MAVMLDFLRIQPGWYVAAIVPNELYIHVRRYSDKPGCAVYGWDLFFSDNEYSFDRHRMIDAHIEGLKFAKIQAEKRASALLRNVPAKVTVLQP